MARFVPRLRVARTDNSGFTLIEVVIAMTVLFGSLASLAYVGTYALTDVGISRDREMATGLVNQAIEQVRALPYDTVAKGLGSSDLLAGGDSNITSSGGNYYFKGEQIPNAANANVTPFVPHRNTVTVGGKNFTVAAYVTYYNGSTASGVYRITVSVTWTSGLRGSSSAKTVQAQTIVYSGGSSGGAGGSGTGTGCSAYCHPYDAPKQPYFSASSTAAPGGITFTAGATGQLWGTDLDTATLWLANRTSNLSIEQVWSVQSNLALPGISYRGPSDTTDTVLGEDTAAASSDNDTSSTSRPEYSSQTATTSSGSCTGSSLCHVWSRLGHSLTFALATGPTGTAIATTNAGGTNTCPNAASPAVNQTTYLPCGNANTSGGNLSAQLTIGSSSGVTGGSAYLALVTPATGSAAHVARATSANSASSCTTTTGGDGCVSASHRRSIGSVSIGGIPSISIGGVPLTLPVGFDYLIKASALNTSIAAEAGIGSTQTTPTRTGTVQVWNGVGYTPVNLSAGAAASISVSPVSLTLGTTTIQVSATLRTGATTAVTCAAPCASATSSAESVLIGDVSYKIVIQGITVIDTVMHLDFGTLTASTLYQAAA